MTSNHTYENETRAQKAVLERLSAGIVAAVASSEELTRRGERGITRAYQVIALRHGQPAAAAYRRRMPLAAAAVAQPSATRFLLAFACPLSDPTAPAHLQA